MHQNQANRDCFAESRIRAAGRRAVLAFIHTIFPPILRMVYGFRIRGEENIPKEGAVSICNHMHCLDCVMLSCAFGKRRAAFLSLRSNLEIPAVGSLIALLGAVPIPSGVSEYKVLIRSVRALLTKGGLFHIYPEGSRDSGNFQLRPFRRGAFELAAAFDMPILPCVIRPYPRSRGRRGLELRIFPAIPPERGGTRGETAAHLEQQARSIMLAALDNEQQRSGCSE